MDMPPDLDKLNLNSAPQPVAAPSAEDATRKLLATLWQRNLPILQDRLHELDRAAEDAVWQTLTPQAREDAAATAHKLAGSLGMFGYTHGTELARKIEQLLEHWDAIDGAELRDLTTALRASLNL
jgi:HPt (histidine-containing phosphotransfer) domain-containing protein